MLPTLNAVNIDATVKHLRHISYYKINDYNGNMSGFSIHFIPIAELAQIITFAA